MDSTKYIGMDVHKESISMAVRNAVGKVVMRGEVLVTFEEGTWAAWLYDLPKPRVTRVVVCDPRRNALLQEGNQNDRVDARKLAELLQNNQLRPVYHGDHGLRTLKELVRSYLTIKKDLSRTMTRQPKGILFFLTSPFIELFSTNLCQACHRLDFGGSRDVFASQESE